jgi:5-methylcytosine-specific restriction protein A
MNSYLFAWNPTKWNWKNLEDAVQQLAEGGNHSEMWSCRSYKTIKPGDRAFIVKLGTEPKGIFASGIITTYPFLAQHWSGENRLVQRVMIEFDVLLNPEKDPILDLDILNLGMLSKQTWTPQSSGISIKSEVVDELEGVWFDFLKTHRFRYHPLISQSENKTGSHTEGTPNEIKLTRYERNPQARKYCIAHYGLTCMACEFNFETQYGQIGRNFIHVHHLTGIAAIGKTYEIDPIKDLRPVCPNCHAIIHKRVPAFTIDEVKEFIKLKK